MGNVYHTASIDKRSRTNEKLKTIELQGAYTQTRINAKTRTFKNGKQIRELNINSSTTGIKNSKHVIRYLIVPSAFKDQ